MNEKPISIPLERIKAIEDYLIRFENVDESGINSKYLKELQSSDPTNWPPIMVVPNGDIGYFLVDGYHRFVAAKAMGIKSLNAYILPNADRETAFNLNREHGLRLSVKERKEHAIWLHEHYPTLSSREIARRTGLDHATVLKTIKQGGGENHQPTGDSSADSLLLSTQRANAARAILRYVERLWETRGLRAVFNHERAINELATALREQSETNPDHKYYLQTLKAIVDLASAPVSKANKSH